MASTWEKIHKIENGKEVVISDEAHTDNSWEFKADEAALRMETRPLHSGP